MVLDKMEVWVSIATAEGFPLQAYAKAQRPVMGTLGQRLVLGEQES